MLVSAPTIYGLPLSAVLYGLTADALDFRRHDGSYRVAKSPQVTQPAVLLQREDDVCGVEMKLCPASLGGNCCPENYACATNSCYSTTSSTSAPSVPSYTYSCPTSQHLCPSSLGYGCCPDGMGCGASRCYFTQPITMTKATAIISTTSGTTTTITTTTAVTLMNRSIPTGFGTLDDRTNDDDESQAANSPPTSVPKYVPPSTETDGGDSQDSSLSTTQLGGIIGGAVALLALVIAAACVLIRHIDKLAGQMSRKSRSSKTRSATKQTSVSDSERRGSQTDSTYESIRRSQTRRKPRSTVRRNRQRRNGLIVARPGNLLTERAQGGQDYSTDIALEVLTRAVNGCSAVMPDPGSGDVVSPTPINDISPGLLNSPSPLSDRSTTELEASSLAQELAGSSSAADLLIHYAQDIPPSDLPRVATRPPLAYQWMRSVGLLRQSENASPDNFHIDEEEWHGFYGSRDHMAGRTGLGISYPEIRGGRPGHHNFTAAKRSYRY